MSRVLRPLVLVALLVVPVGLTPARDAAAGTPTDQLRDRIDRVVGILDDGDLKANPAARRAALRGVTGEIFDFTQITRRALRRHWQTASAGEPRRPGRRAFTPLGGPEQRRRRAHH